MKPRFADAAWFLTLLNPRDALHASAVRLHEAGTESLVTSEWVLLEVADAFSAPANRRLFRDLMESLAAAADATKEIAELGGGG